MRVADKTEEDLSALLSSELGRVISPGQLHDALIDWVELKNRQLPDTKWNVEKSRQFVANPFSQQFAAGLQIIENNFVAGRTNRGHQSRTAERIDYHDLLFNDWGILHFHLSDTYESDGYCQRTGPVLFAYFHRETVYFLDILEHGRANPSVWADEHLILVIDTNWPALADQYVIKDAVGLSHNYTQEDRIRLRQAGVTALIKVNGRVFSPFGLGLNTAKGSTRFSLQAIKLLKVLREWVDRMVEAGDFVYPNGDQLSAAVSASGNRNAVLRLKFEDGRLHVFEESSGQTVLISQRIVGVL